MWIALGIIGFLALLITVIILLPVRIIIKNDENNPLILRYKLLGKTFGEDPDPNDPVVRTLKTATGVDRLDKAAAQQSIRKDGLKKTVTETYKTLADLLKEVVVLLKICTVTRLHVSIVCAGDGADEVAMHYGQCCTATYSLLNVLRSLVKVRKRGCKIDIRSDFLGGESSFRYDVELTVRVGRVISSLWRVVMAEAARQNPRPTAQKKPQQK